ncbi:MAG TPA: NHL repeat-containing protein [Caulobacteraceae bacterium]
MFQLDQGGKPTKSTADYVIGEPSLYGRKSGPEETTRSTGSRLGGYAFDEVNQRMFVRDIAVNAWAPHGRVLVYDVRPDHMKDGMEAVAVLGQTSFTSYKIGGIGQDSLGSIDEPAMDSKNQRLFIIDRKNNRIMVWDVEPSRLTATPLAMAVLGQQDFNSGKPGSGPAGLSRPSGIVYDKKNDRLFVTDAGNNRVVVYDVRPGQLKTGMAATAVIGQPDFTTKEAGLSATQLSRPARIEYEDKFQRLFVTDTGNRRMMIFNVAPAGLKNGAAAANVLGQPDFTTRAERASPKKWVPGETEIDQDRERLFTSEDGGNRMLVFDIRPGKFQNNADATNLMWKSQWDQTDDQNVADLNQVDEVRGRPLLDDKNDILYAAGGYEGRNGVSMRDVAPAQLQPTGQPAFALLGQYDWNGKPDYTARAANGRGTPRDFYPRGIAVDTVDHRLFINDQYMQRVLVFDLDDENRILNRDASIVLGQPDAYTGALHDPAANTMHVPLNLAYDPIDKHLFVADGRFNRVLVFDARPGVLKTFDNAIAVIGQKDFTAVERTVGPAAINMGVSDGNGITSTSPSPLGFSVDVKNRRLFFSDGTNNRVLVYDIGAGHIKTGMSASAVIGQPDMQSNKSRTDDQGFNVPNELAFDADHNRLFVIDGGNNRLLVFKAGPGDIHPGMKATAVLGQMDFKGSSEAVRLDTTVVDEQTGRRRFRNPNGVAYDPVRQNLYVNDKGNDRILVFDVAPDKLTSGMAAIGVLGQKDFVSRIGGYAEEEELQDPRQIDFDADNQRLYVTDSFFARLMIFDMPRSDRPVDLPPFATRAYSTTDPWNGRPEGPGKDVRAVWQGSLANPAGAPGALLTYDHTAVQLDPKSLRRSRLLISETSLQAPDPAKTKLFAVDEGKAGSSQIVVGNAAAAPARLQFKLRLAGGQSLDRERTLKPGGELIASVADLFGAGVEGQGTLRLTSNVEVTAFMLHQTPTTRNEQLLTAVPSEPVAKSAEPITLANLEWGGGYQTELTLTNPHAAAIQGKVMFFGRDGAPADVGDGTNAVAYKIAPDGVFHWKKASADALAGEVYAVVQADGAEAPSGAATVSLWNKALLLNQRTTPVRAAVNRAWIPVDTNASIIRSGESEMSFAFANPSDRIPAELRMVLFDASGKEKGRYVQILPPHTQRSWTLGELFNVSKFEGSLRLWSDTAVAVSAKRTTKSIRGEPVETEVDFFNEDALRTRHAVQTPGIMDGEGLATQVLFANPNETPSKQTWKFASPDGAPTEVVMR